MSAFTGFPPETFAFFQGLAFIETLAPAIGAISPRYRDVRFYRDAGAEF